MKLTSRSESLSKWSQIEGHMSIDEPWIKLTTYDGRIQFIVAFSDFEKGKLLLWLSKDKKAVEFCRRSE